MSRLLLALVTAGLFAAPARGDLTDPKPVEKKAERAAPVPVPIPNGDAYCDRIPQCGIHGPPCCLGSAFLPKREQARTGDAPHRRPAASRR